MIRTVLLGATLVHAAPVLAGEPWVQIQAEISADLQTITGTLTVVADTPLQWVDPLAHLPAPPDDRTALRTWVGAPEQGLIRIIPLDAGRVSFTTYLPRRWGDVGVHPNRSLFANGQWYPQHLVDGRIPVTHWRVQLRLPEGAVGALGDTTGSDTLTWSGRGERASLAVFKRGRITSLAVEDTQIRVLSRRRVRRAWTRRLPTRLNDMKPAETSIDTVVVQAPLRRRLARSGFGLSYVSDRAWRLSPGLARYHDLSVSRAVLGGALDIEDPFVRHLAAATIAIGSRPTSPTGALRWLSWNPVIDAILNDRTLPFWGDVFDAAHSEDPLLDDLTEMFSPSSSTRALARQLHVLHGAEPVVAFGAALADGASVAGAARQVGIDAGLIERWRLPTRDLDIQLAVDGRARVATVTRQAPADVPPQAVVLRVDKETFIHTLDDSRPTVTQPLSRRPRRVVVDPGGLIDQTSRSHDAWPPRFTVTSAAWVDRINVTEGWLSGFSSAWARGRDDTRNVWSLGASFDQQTLPALSAGWLHRRGPLQDGLNRPHRISLWVEPAWTNPRFAGGDRPILTLGGGGQYAWDTRVSELFPLRGRRFSIAATGGVMPTEGTHWTTLGIGGAGILSPHPRWAWATNGSLSMALGDATQRLLWFGGPGSMLSLPPASAIGRGRAIARTEIRWAPVRHASVPMLGAAWLAEVQISAGIEGGVLHSIDGELLEAVGVTGGISLVFDLLGASPSLIGVTVGHPFAGRAVSEHPNPQVVLRFGQAF